MKEEFKKFIEEHINKCNIVIENNDYNGAKELQGVIINAFSQFIPNIDESLDYNFVYPSNRQVNYLGNIKKLKDKLRILLMTGGTYCIENANSEKISPISITTNNGINNSGNSTNTNSNTNTVNANFDIKTELDKARKQLEENEYLDDDAKAEINEQLDQIDEVMSESSSNNEKWKKLKGVISWVASKGYKIGEMVMPIITKALFPEE